MTPFKHPVLWVPLLSGVGGLVLSVQLFGYVAAVLAIPAIFLIAGGLRLVYLPDLRASRLVALGSVLGMVISLLLLWLVWPLALAAMATFAVNFLLGGFAQLRRQPQVEGVPAPAIGVVYSAQVALDDLMLSTLAPALPSQEDFAVAARETDIAYHAMDEAGWLENPVTFHHSPPALAHVESTPLRLAGLECQSLQFASEFEPRTELPGRERFMDWQENRTCHAVVVRQKESAPWLLCVHGFGMGNPKIDIKTFRIPALVKELGINVALITLPLHGQRAPGGFSGDKFIGLSPVDFVHAEAQAIWDLRRLIGWMRGQGAERIAVHGISLGGYTSSLLSCIEPGIDTVIAGVPPTDITATRNYISTSLERRMARVAGLEEVQSRAVHSVVSPLAMTSLVPRSSRYIYAATGDQFVPVEQVAALWRHWEQPEISWCTGGHLSALKQREPREFVHAVLNNWANG